MHRQTCLARTSSACPSPHRPSAHYDGSRRSAWRQVPPYEQKKSPVKEPYQEKKSPVKEPYQEKKSPAKEPYSEEQSLRTEKEPC